jgi:hypothetical protein
MIAIPERAADLELVGYLERWCLTPRSDGGNLYLHHILAPDPDIFLHDHPWWFRSTVLAGGYDEQLANGDIVRRQEGDSGEHAAMDAHVITHVVPGTWTLVLTGRTEREWGFLTAGGWVHHDAFEGRRHLVAITRNDYRPD